MKGLQGRLARLEAALCLTRTELLGFYRDLLGVVAAEAGEATAARVGWRMVAQRAGEVLATHGGRR